MMDSVFDNIMNANENSEFTVKVSFLEIYNEKIQDLLDSNKYLVFFNLLIHFFSQKKQSRCQGRQKSWDIYSRCN